MQFPTVSVDTRTLVEGQLFFALPGDCVDGHRFLREVKEKKGRGAVIHESYLGEDFGLPLIRSKNVLISLQNLAKMRLLEHPGRKIAITGSLGKTTTKEFANQLISLVFSSAKSPGNANSQIGLPLTILNHLNGDEEVLIFEMGMTKALEIENLVKIAPPEIALITEIAPVHIGLFSSIEGIVEAKAEIFSHPSTKLGLFPSEVIGRAVFEKKGNFPKNTYSTKDDKADFYLSFFEEGMLLKTKMWGDIRLPPLEVPGAHNRHNFLAAAALALSLGVPKEALVDGVKALKLPPKRLERIEKKGVIFINDSYNASLSSVQMALETLPEPKCGGLKIAVLGEMLELGALSKQHHEEVGRKALECVDEMWCLGELCEPIISLWKKARRTSFFFTKRKELSLALKKRLKEGDVVLVKGSLAKQMWKVIEEC